MWETTHVCPTDECRSEDNGLTQVVRLGCQYLDPLSHPDSPQNHGFLMTDWKCYILVLVLQEADAMTGLHQKESEVTLGTFAV